MLVDGAGKLHQFSKKRVCLHLFLRKEAGTALFLVMEGDCSTIFVTLFGDMCVCTHQVAVTS